MSIEDRIVEAKRLFDDVALQVHSDHGLRSLLKGYEEAVRHTRDFMMEIRMTEACGDCAKQDPGGCCFEGVEEWFDSILLLINMLMGVAVPTIRVIPGGCLFLGEEGCSFLVWHSFCINYLCPSLKRALPASQVLSFLSIAGREIDAGWQLERAIRRRVLERS